MKYPERRVLLRFLAINDVSAAVIVGKNGEVIGSAAKSGINLDATGSMVSICLRSPEDIGGTLALGRAPLHHWRIR